MCAFKDYFSLSNIEGEVVEIREAFFVLEVLMLLC